MVELGVRRWRSRIKAGLLAETSKRPFLAQSEGNFAMSVRLSLLSHDRSLLYDTTGLVPLCGLAERRCMVC